jgi:hypothetical protein
VPYREVRGALAPHDEMRPEVIVFGMGRHGRRLAEQLAHEAQHQRAELVVLGSRAKGRLEAALLGSVASNVALMESADVLLVREGAAPALSAIPAAGPGR